MKILMITPDAQMIDRRILLEAKALIEAGNEVTLLAGFECQDPSEYEEDGIQIKRYNYDWDDERLKRIRSKLPENDKIKMFVNKLFMKVAWKVFWINPFEMFMLDKLMKYEADVIHVHDLPCLKVGVKAAQNKGIPIVFDAHEIYYSQEVLSQKQQKFYRKLESKLIHRVTEVITVNPFIADLMKNRYGLQTAPNVILNATELPESFEYDTDIIRQKTGISKNEKIVLYQGWLSGERNLDTLVRSVKYYPDDTHLAIVGYGAFEETLKNIVKEEGTESKVHFLGQVKSTEMLYYSSSADLGFIPYKPIDENHLYCSPNKLFEYVLAGLPIVSENLPYLSSVNDEYGIIRFCDIDDEKAIGAIVNELMSQPNTLNEMKHKCLEAAKTLNWKVESDKLVQIYERIKLRKGRS